MDVILLEEFKFKGKGQDLTDVTDINGVMKIIGHFNTPEATFIKDQQQELFIRALGGDRTVCDFVAAAAEAGDALPEDDPRGVFRRNVEQNGVPLQPSDPVLAEVVSKVQSLTAKVMLVVEKMSDANHGGVEKARIEKETAEINAKASENAAKATADAVVEKARLDKEAVAEKARLEKEAVAEKARLEKETVEIQERARIRIAEIDLDKERLHARKRARTVDDDLESEHVEDADAEPEPAEPEVGHDPGSTSLCPRKVTEPVDRSWTSRIDGFFVARNWNVRKDCGGYNMADFVSFVMPCPRSNAPSFLRKNIHKKMPYQSVSKKGQHYCGAKGIKFIACAIRATLDKKRNSQRCASFDRVNSFLRAVDEM
jgi:hypothetical protein